MGRALLSFFVSSSSLILALVVSETLFRFVGIGQPSIYQREIKRGLVLRPNARMTYEEEGHSYVVVNSEGYIDDEWSKKAQSGLRIAVVGDSFIEGLQVERRERFTELLKEALNKNCSDFKNVEVFNFGVGGMGTYEELETLNRDILRIKPHWVLLSFSVVNDLTDNLRARAKKHIVSKSSLDWKDEFFGRPLISVINYLSGRSQVVNYSVTALLKLKSFLIKGQLYGKPVHFLTSAGVSSEIYSSPQKGSRMDEAWSNTFILLREFKSVLDAKNVRFFLFTNTTPAQVYPDPSERERFRNAVLGDNLFFVEKKMSEFAHHEGIDFFPLAPSMQKIADDTKTFFHGFGKRLGRGHWNQIGHQVAAKLVSEKFCEAHSRHSVEP